MAIEQIEEKTSGSKKNAVYDVASEGNLFATVNVAAGPFKLGDVVQGSVEFPEAQEGMPTCIQVTLLINNLYLFIFRCWSEPKPSSKVSIRKLTIYIALHKAWSN